MRKFFLFVGVLFLLSSCAHAISEQYRQAAKQGVGFGQILKNPEIYMNSMFIIGGTIVETTNTSKGAEIELIQNPVNRYGEITDKDISEGRLILVSSRRLDPLIYKSGRTLTFAGKLIGTREKTFAGAAYRFPVFEAVELHLWRQKTHYYEPYPYMPYPWGYDPFYYPYRYGPAYTPYFYPYW
jgi:outer membrane lipoprotein